jgi:MFS family permease
MRAPGPLSRLLAVTAISGLGDWLTTLALVVVLFQATHTAVAPAAYMVVRVAPRPVGAWLGGVLTDTRRIGRPAAVSSLVQGALSALLIIPATTGHGLWAIYLLVGAAQILGGSWQPITAGLLAQIVAPERRLMANRTYSLIGSMTMLLAPAAGALLLPVMGAGPLLATDALSFMLAALLLLSLPAVTPAPSPSGGRTPLLVGFGTAWRDPLLRNLTVGTFGAALTVTAFQGVLTPMAQRLFGQASDAGWLYAAIGLGGMVGALCAAWPRLRHRGVIVPGLALEILLLGLVAVIINPVLALLFVFASTLAAVVAQVQAAILVQHLTGQVGRVQGTISTTRFIGQTAGAVGGLLLLLAVRWPEMVILLTAASLLLFATAVATSRLTERRRSIPTEEAAALD